MGQAPDDLKQITAVTAEVDALRSRTQQLVEELERRLRERAARAKGAITRFRRVTDVRAQIKAHPVAAIGVSTAAALALGLGVWLVVTRAVEARKTINRLRTRLHGYRALLAEPHRALRKREPLGKRLLAAVLIAGATTIVRNLAARLIAPAPRRRLLPPASARS